MSGDTIKILLAMIGYMAAVIGIGVYFAKRAQANSGNYFLGGRSLGPWVGSREYTPQASSSHRMLF